MGLKNAITNFVKYNHWANETLTAWLMGLDKDLLYKETPSSFPSIAATVQHLQESHRFWLCVIKSVPISMRGETSDAASNLRLLLADSKAMLNDFGAYTEEELLTKVSSPDAIQSRYEFILHAINHNSYHRGQIVTICRRLGVTHNIPPTDYDVFFWSEHQFQPGLTP